MHSSPLSTRLKGLTSVLHSTSPQYAEPLPEIVTPLLKKLLSDSSFTHVVSATSSFGKSLLPRVSANLDVPTVSDVTSVDHDASNDSTTVTRPVYAGNAISTVSAPSSIPIKFFTVRGTANDLRPQASVLNAHISWYVFDPSSVMQRMDGHDVFIRTIEKYDIWWLVFDLVPFRARYG
ncbi:hypothetical protein DFP72DRAFT_1166411 [Ephemerocybe angulata]|uniref:Probable electron transfer flavoprotein subunit alpha, mitochondrial n=1 Tax=Ephemerocybe angulata TaxID=980116 RepID=A0A8H6MDL7_9AGAR|nr:hypothetical protein DFP72DRAFT_1166411 [Tulosesus angulatus]